jgi:hypothetical protein
MGLHGVTPFSGAHRNIAVPSDNPSKHDEMSPTRQGGSGIILPARGKVQPELRTLE